MINLLQGQPEFQSVVINRNGDAPLNKERLPNKYAPRNLRALEYIYDTEGVISSGGLESVDAMLAHVDLEDKTLLDVGCGFGGVDLYLASKHKVSITGVDRESYMIECANALMDRSSAPLKGKIQYMTLSDPLKLDAFADNSFDLILCIQVLYHLPPPERKVYLKEMFRVLKPNGKIMTQDWLTSITPYTDRVKKALNIQENREPFGYAVTPSDYELSMQTAGFTQVIFTDTTDQEMARTEKHRVRLRTCASSFSNELGADFYEHVVNSWDHCLNALIPRELLSGIFTAVKQVS